MAGKKSAVQINIHIYMYSYSFKGWITASPEKNKLKKKNPDQDQNCETQVGGREGDADASCLGTAAAKNFLVTQDKRQQSAILNRHRKKTSAEQPLKVPALCSFSPL